MKRKAYNMDGVFFSVERDGESVTPRLKAGA